MLLSLSPARSPHADSAGTFRRLAEDLDRTVAQSSDCYLTALVGDRPFAARGPLDVRGLGVSGFLVRDGDGYRLKIIATQATAPDAVQGITIDLWLPDLRDFRAGATYSDILGDHPYRLRFGYDETRRDGRDANVLSQGAAFWPCETWRTKGLSFRESLPFWAFAPARGEPTTCSKAISAACGSERFTFWLGRDNQTAARARSRCPPKTVRNLCATAPYPPL